MFPLFFSRKCQCYTNKRLLLKAKDYFGQVTLRIERVSEYLKWKGAGSELNLRPAEPQASHASVSRSGARAPSAVRPEQRSGPADSARRRGQRWLEAAAGGSGAGSQSAGGAHPPRPGRCSPQGAPPGPAPRPLSLSRPARPRPGPALPASSGYLSGRRPARTSAPARPPGPSAALDRPAAPRRSRLGNRGAAPAPERRAGPRLPLS